MLLRYHRNSGEKTNISSFCLNDFVVCFLCDDEFFEDARDREPVSGKYGMSSFDHTLTLNRIVFAGCWEVLEGPELPDE